jgi:carboxymethylenebutenolidase
MVIQEDFVDIDTPTGAMRTHRFWPVAAGRFPGIVLYSEIFQLTGPIARLARFYAGHGYAIVVPEIFHELEAPGAVLGYDQAGADRGNHDKITKTIASYDDDARAVILYLTNWTACTGAIGVFGVCIGGHLAFRAAMNPDVRATACYYATDIHKRSLGAGQRDDSLERSGEIQGELMMVWGRQDPHIPAEGRAAIHARLAETGRNFTWHEFNGAHAFLRDEGHRYDPELAVLSQQMNLSLFHRALRGG